MHLRRHLEISLAVLFALLQVDGTLAQEDVLRLPIGSEKHRNVELGVGLDAVVDTRTGEEIAPSALVGVLAQSRVVLVGEEHTDTGFHDVQLHVLDSLRAAAVPLMIGLEMFPASRQEVLDRWVRGVLDETAFIEEADWYSVWGYHWGYYRAIFEFARANAVRMIGLNGESGDSPPIDSIEVSDTSADDHIRLVRAFFEADTPVHGGLADEQLAELASAQARRDAVMAGHVATALDRNPLHTMVVLAGSGHVLYDAGIARQLPTRYRDTAASIVPVPIEERMRTVQASVARIVWGIPDSRFPRYPELGIVAIDTEHGLRVIHVDGDSPADSAGIRPDDRLTALGGLALWRRSDLSRAMAAFAWGDVVTVSLEREASTVLLDVALRRRHATATERD